MNDKEKILNGLMPLFSEARQKGLWFHCHYQDLWLSPEELQKANDSGSYIWGAVNWDLRDPREYLAQVKKELQRAQDTVDAIAERIRRINDLKSIEE